MISLMDIVAAFPLNFHFFWFKLVYFELKQISNTYKYIQYKLGSE